MRIAIIIGLLAAPALADTINVDPGMTQADIQDAIDNAAFGDVVKFSKGTYVLDNGPLEVTINGVTLQGSKAVLDAEYRSDVLVVRADDVTVTGFEIVNGGDSGFEGTTGAGSGILVEPFGGEGDTPDGIIITKNRVGACRTWGISVEATNATITKNRVDGNGNDGIFYSDGPSTEGGGSTTVISGNSCQLNNDKGIEIDLSAGGTLLIVEKNFCSTNNEDGIRIDLDTGGGEGEKGPPPSLVAKNKCIGNGDNGIAAFDNNEVGLIIEKNTAQGNFANGIRAEGEGILVMSNKAQLNNTDGIDAKTRFSQFVKNKVTANLAAGICVSSNVKEGTDGGNHLEGNTCQSNGRDGIAIHSGDNDLIKNKSNKNFGDGIDVNGGNANELTNNTCNGNNHEGIDNGGGTNADINGNKAKSNAFGEGPDIAGNGSTSTFADNSFGTGGEATAPRLDFPD